MIYPQNFEQKIGFDQIRNLIKAKCLSTLGEEKKTDGMAFSSDYEEINCRLEEVVEFVRILEEEDEFPSQYFFRCAPFVETHPGGRTVSGRTGTVRPASLAGNDTRHRGFSAKRGRGRRRFALTLPCPTRPSCRYSGISTAHSTHQQHS